MKLFNDEELKWVSQNENFLEGASLLEIYNSKIYLLNNFAGLRERLVFSMALLRNDFSEISLTVSSYPEAYLALNDGDKQRLVGYGITIPLAKSALGADWQKICLDLFIKWSKHQGDIYSGADNTGLPSVLFYLENQVAKHLNRKQVIGDKPII